MIEIWKDIRGYEGLYQVSSLGRVKSLAKEILIKNGYTRHQEERFLALHPNTHGYLTVGIYKNAKRKHRTIHRLVAEAFLPNRDKSLEVNHKDGDKINNRVDNLEWCSGYKNLAHAYEHKLSKYNHTPIPVTQLSMPRINYPSLTKASKATGVSLSIIRARAKEENGWKFTETRR